MGGKGKRGGGRFVYTVSMARHDLKEGEKLYKKELAKLTKAKKEAEVAWERLRLAHSPVPERTASVLVKERLAMRYVDALEEVKYCEEDTGFAKEQLESAKEDLEAALREEKTRKALSFKGGIGGKGPLPLVIRKRLA